MDDWSTLIRLPMTLLLALAGLALLFALLQLAAMLRHRREHRPLAASGRFLLLLVGLGLGLLLLGAGLALRGYRLLAEERPVLEVDARILSPQRWALVLTWPDGATRRLELAGDAFRVEAVVVKWKLPALLAGAPPLYRLDRVDGRYDDPAQEAQAPRTVVGFAPAGAFDLLALRRRYPQWLPEVDAVYGSGAFLPLVDQGHYTVGLMRTGALVARPDEATAQRLAAPLGG
ncbi:hypothetical protein [Fulvimonas soli]|jgi:hypothetical protein|uniref:Cation/multidrug efflux pump n=1 Tax=Fulvimonas soli TaxID=155197 RepID=A0A316IHJ2_9GAMM|nr:hypothetical protein [Fulvimonas soli]PWK92523.1 hypothetical protein C7456_102258 [Fulvimonas soli]TNY27735.1 hypothetical protein BV497_01585 [Fulvimonas soli]